MAASVNPDIREIHSEYGHLKRNGNGTALNVTLVAKKKHLKLLMHPPSIPTQFQTFYYNDQEPKAFNTTASRFNQRPVKPMKIDHVA